MAKKNALLSLKELTKRDVYTARLHACEKYKYLRTALHSLVMVPVEDVLTCATDEWWRFYYNPHLFANIKPSQGAALMAHEVWHHLLRHFVRGKLLGVNVNLLESLAANVCTDLEVNQKCGLIENLPFTPVTPELYKVPENLLFEEYWELLHDKLLDDFKAQCGCNENEECNEVGKNVGNGNCGSGGCGQDGPWKLPPPDKCKTPGVTQTRGEIIIKQTAQAIKESKGCGNLPAGAVRWAEGELTAKVNWREELIASFQGMIASTLGDQMLNPKRISRRQHLSPDILIPAHCSLKPIIDVFVDTSGSVSNKMLAQAVAEVDGLLASLGKNATINFYSVDAAVYEKTPITCTSEIQFVGGGGTDMCLCFKKEEEKFLENPDDVPSSVIIITDGLTGWPENAPGLYKVIVLLLGNGGYGPTWCSESDDNNKLIRIQE